MDTKPAIFILAKHWIFYNYSKLDTITFFLFLNFELFLFTDLTFNLRLIDPLLKSQVEPPPQWKSIY
jgi:hypothetical protein